MTTKPIRGYYSMTTTTQPVFMLMRRHKHTYDTSIPDMDVLFLDEMYQLIPEVGPTTRDQRVINMAVPGGSVSRQRVFGFKIPRTPSGSIQKYLVIYTNC